MVPSTRVERVAYPLGKGRSIQLSYEGMIPKAPQNFRNGQKVGSTQPRKTNLNDAVYSTQSQTLRKKTHHSVLDYRVHGNAFQFFTAFQES